MTRIALIPSAYPPSLGGVEELTRHLALSLVGAGDQVEVWTGHPNDATPETVEIRDGLVVRRMPMPLPATNVSALRRTSTTGVHTLFSLRSAVAAFRPDVLHVQCFGPNGTYATALARLSGLPMVITLQGETLMDDHDAFGVSRVLRASIRKGMASAAAVTACSSFTLADAVERFGLPRGKGRVIPNGVDLTGWGEGRPLPAQPRRSFAEADRPYVLALGRVVEKKGFDLLLDAFAAAGAGVGAFDLVIGGTGSAEAGLGQAAQRLGIAGRVRFAGRLSREEVAAAMAGAALFVMPSRLEPFGIVILEAWRAGVAVVASSRGGAPEFVTDGVDGVLVDPFDSDAFASTLVGLGSDPDRRAAMVEAGRASVQRFAWPEITRAYREVYSELNGPDRVRSGHDDGSDRVSQGEWMP